MEIHFCDLCNESVPQGHLDEGKAFIRKGRVVCATCEALMSVEDEAAEAAAAAQGVPSVSPSPTSPPPAGVAPSVAPGHAPGSAWGQPAAPPPATQPVQVGRRGGGGVLLTGMLALASLMVAVGAILMSQQGVETLRTDAIGRIEATVRSFQQSQAGLERDLSSLQIETTRQLGEISNEVARLGDRYDGDSQRTQELITEIRTDLKGLEGKVGALESVGATVGRQRDDIASLNSAVTQFRTDIGDIAEAILDLQNQMAGVDLGAGGGPAPVEPVGPAPWLGLTEDLKSQNSGTRWNAVQALGETKDPAVIKYLVPMLGDEDIFVRMATARILGELEDPRSIPALIGALEDDEPSVREAAVVSLRSLSGRNFKFDPTSPSEADRNRKIKAWRDWWKKAQDDMLPDGPIEQM